MAVQLAQLELIRRNNGAEAQTVSMPEPRARTGLSAEDLEALVAEWEGNWFADAYAEPGDDDLLFPGCVEVTRHLADCDGVPVRLARLNPADFAIRLVDDACVEACGSPPPGYHPYILDSAATLYERAAEKGNIDKEVGIAIAAELHALGLAHAAADRGETMRAAS